MDCAKDPLNFSISPLGQNTYVIDIPNILNTTAAGNNSVVVTLQNDCTWLGTGTGTIAGGADANYGTVTVRMSRIDANSGCSCPGAYQIAVTTTTPAATSVFLACDINIGGDVCVPNFCCDDSLANAAGPGPAGLVNTALDFGANPIPASGPLRPVGLTVSHDKANIYCNKPTFCIQATCGGIVTPACPNISSLFMVSMSGFGVTGASLDSHGVACNCAPANVSMLLWGSGGCDWDDMGSFDPMVSPLACYGCTHFHLKYDGTNYTFQAFFNDNAADITSAPYWQWQIASPDACTIKTADNSNFSQQLGTVTVTGDTHTNTTVDNVSAPDIAKLVVGWSVTGTGFATGTTIVSIGATSFVTNIPTTATNAAVTITAQLADYCATSSVKVTITPVDICQPETVPVAACIASTCGGTDCGGDLSNMFTVTVAGAVASGTCDCCPALNGVYYVTGGSCFWSGSWIPITAAAVKDPGACYNTSGDPPPFSKTTFTLDYGLTKLGSYTLMMALPNGETAKWQKAATSACVGVTMGDADHLTYPYHTYCDFSLITLAVAAGANCAPITTGCCAANPTPQLLTATFSTTCFTGASTGVTLTYDSVSGNWTGNIPASTPGFSCPDTRTWIILCCQLGVWYLSWRDYLVSDGSPTDTCNGAGVTTVAATSVSCSPLSIVFNNVTQICCDPFLPSVTATVTVTT